MQDDLNREDRELNVEEQETVENELKKKSQQTAKNETKKGIKMLVRSTLKAISTILSSIIAAIGPVLLPIIIILIVIFVLIWTFFSIFFSNDDMNTERAAEFWFPIAKEDIYDQYFVDGDKEEGALIPYEDSSVDKVRTVISSPMGPRNRSDGNDTITWDEFYELSYAEQEKYHRPGRTVQQDQHAGIDIGATKLIPGDQTEIIASQSGTVTYSSMDNGNGYGNYIEITSDPSYSQESMTRYAHLSELLVSEGDHVNQGQVIGIIGGSGGYAVHLHFEIHQDGKVIDPRTKIEWDYPWRIGSLYSGEASALIAYIKAWEGHEGLSEDGTKYKIGLVPSGSTYTRTVGYGIDLDTSGYEERFIAAGYDTSAGSYVDVEFVDAIMYEEVNERRNGVISTTTSCNPPLTNEQIDALTVTSYQYGNIGNFVRIYNQYGNTEALKNNVQAYTSGGGLGDHYFLENPSDGRAEANWKLFHEGIYTDKLGNEIVVNSSTSSTSSSNSNVNRMLKEAARIANDNSYYYSWGGNGPKGYDCSGFTKHLYSTYLGIDLPRQSDEQANYLSEYRIPISQAQPGDLLWHKGHVGIYYGNGQSVEASSPSSGICFQNVSYMEYTYAYSLSRYFADH